MGAGSIQLPAAPDYAGMQAEDRKYRQESEERQLQMMNDMEDKRVQREASEIRRQDRVRENELSALETLENSITENTESVTKFEDDKDKDVVIDFYDSLSQGQGQGVRPV